MEPHALLFDEPLSNLDAKLRERMRFELIELQRQLGVPAVYVTHDQTEAMVMSDRILVMQKGVIAQEGPPEEIYARPANAFVADFIGLCNFFEAEVAAAAGPGRWQVRSPLGSHGCFADMPLSAGDRVTLMVRPERIAIVAHTDGDGCAADVRHRYFLGAQTEYQLAVGEVLLRAQVTAPVIYPVGTRVTLRVAPEDCRVVQQGKA
jgi:iron(III) transport system ATP-binding protein